MVESILGIVGWLIGIDQGLSELSLPQMVSRTVIVYGIALLLIRIGKRRFLGGYTAFDILMGFVVGSILSRAITGRENLLNASIVILTLMAVHALISFITFKFSNASDLIKNTERQLISDGEVNEEAMRRSKLGENDLLQALRRQGGVESPSEVKSAYLERDGNITVIPKRQDAKVIEITVENNVQTVKVELA